MLLVAVANRTRADQEIPGPPNRDPDSRFPALEVLTPGVISSIPDDCITKERLVCTLADEYESALVRRHRGVRGLDGDLDC